MPGQVPGIFLSVTLQYILPLTLIMPKRLLAILLLLISITKISSAQTTDGADRICGKWLSADKNLMVEVYRDKNEYKGRTIWFKADDNSKGMDEWTDKHNPDAALRSRKLLGLNVVYGLKYDAGDHDWEHGHIYDAKSGRTYDAAARLDGQDVLKVTGYWQFKFIGRTMTFNRVSGVPVVSTP